METIKKELMTVVAANNLEPYAMPVLNFDNYYKKQNFCGRVVFNGNASFFVDPMEATSTTTALGVNLLARDMWVGVEGASQDACNKIYEDDIHEVEAMIALHYLKNPGFNTEFWNNATYLAEEKIWLMLNSNGDFRTLIEAAIHGTYPGMRYGRDVGTWNLFSYYQNINGLDISRNLHNVMPGHSH